MMNADKEMSREEQDFLNAINYHKQLLVEIMDLFRLYCSICGEHAKEMEPALSRAIFFTLFGSIEASCRVLAAVALFTDSAPHGEDDPPDSKPHVALTPSEKHFLRQESEEISRRNCTAQHCTKFVSLQDALIGYPTIYARMFNTQLSIDKSCSEWQDFMGMKRLRDIGAHGNSNELRSSPESMRVSYNDIKRLLECRRWYCCQLMNLPWLAKINAKGEIDYLDRLLEAGFSSKCKGIRAERYIMNNESKEIKNLFDELCMQPERSFPQPYKHLEAPLEQGVYIIRKGKIVLHVGRTLDGVEGIRQRLKNHLHDSSSFTTNYLQGNKALLWKDGYTYQYRKLEDLRKRALLEAYATGMLCPRYTGSGETTKEQV